MIVGTTNGDLRVAQKSLLDDWPWSASPPSESILGGRFLTGDQAVGLPALLACLLYLADSIAMLPSIVYKPDGKGVVRDEGSPVWKLFHERPSDHSTPADLRGDVVLSLAGGGNSYLRKWKNAGGRGKVVELEPLDRRFVRARRGAGGRTIFDDFSQTGDPRDSTTRTASEIIHVRLGRLNASSALTYSPEGMSPITAARIAWSLGLKRQQFEMAYYDNDARPGVVLTFPQAVTEEQAESWTDLWDSRHASIENKHRTGVVGGGGDVKTIPISLMDAQFVEANRMTLAQAGAVYRIPKSFLNDGDSKQPTSPDMDRIRLVTFGIGPYLQRMDEAFSADRDLFPNGRADGYLEHLADALLRPDQGSRYTAYKDARQGGWVTANEIRGFENLPWMEGGDELLETPVGGHPNDPKPKPAPALADDGE